MYFLLFFYLFSCIGSSIGIYYFFKNNNIPAWKAFVPFLNKWELMKVLNKPKSFILWFFFPLLNIVGSISLFSELLEAHRIYDFKSHYFGLFFVGGYFPYLFKNKNPKFYGVNGEIANEKFRKPKYSILREWSDSLLYALSVAMIIRTFVFEIYTIPTSSLEGTLLVGDYLLVDKVSYGIRMPNTPLSFPLVQNTLPVFSNYNSYVEWIKIPYIRFKQFLEIKRNDLVVFNFPEGDTVTQEYQSAAPYLALLQSYGRETVHNNFNIVHRPVDKRDNYVKRCVAIPGDKLKIENGILFINNQKAYQAPKIQTSYSVYINNAKGGDFYLLEKELNNLGIHNQNYSIDNQKNTFLLNVDQERLNNIKQIPYIDSIIPIIEQKPGNSEYMFPHDRQKFDWTIDNYGELTMPKKGETKYINNKNISIYERIISIYEDNKLEIKGEDIYINNIKTENYTFKMNYYFMMGDNRHNSQDSRSWGFVPEDHIVGRPLLVLFSWDALKSGIRWDRIFKYSPKCFTPN